MLLQIADILDKPTLSAIRDALAPETLWAKGATTASGRAKAVKNNHQARPDAPAVKGVLEKVRKALFASPVFTSAARPAEIARLMINRYGDGMAYGRHTDAPYIDDVRTDLSFTLFLNDPQDYGGGELIIDAAGAEDVIKLPAGAMVLYPATSIHRVEAVTRGTRLAAIGWIKSRVKSPAHRALLFDLDRAMTALSAARHRGAPPGDDTFDQLLNIKHNLLREFGE